MFLTFYDGQSGRISVRLDCHESERDGNVALYPGLSVLDADSDPETDYVDLEGVPAVKPRPELPGFDRLAIDADGEDAAVLALAGPFKATIDGTEYEIATPGEDGLFRLFLAADVPAVYSVQVEAWPYLPYSAEVTAT